MQSFNGSASHVLQWSSYASSPLSFILSGPPQALLQSWVQSFAVSASQTGSPFPSTQLSTKLAP